ncbi:MAG: hypothetical protein ACKODX_01085 [Gemmata sp.]
MSDIGTTAGLMTVKQAATMLPGRTGGNPTATTVGRWVRVGAVAADKRRVRLRATRVGSSYFVAPADLTAFLAELNADASAKI